MESWIEAHRAGLAAYIVGILPPMPPYLDDFMAAQKLLAKCIATEPGSDPDRRWRFFLGLPPGVLEVLAEVTTQKKVGAEVSAVAAEIDAALHELCEASEPSAVGRAQIWAYHALLGDGGALRLVRLGRTLFGQRWRQLEKTLETVERIATSLGTLRDPWAATPERRVAIREMGNVLNETPHWRQIENILLHNQFSWPLLVLEKEEAVAGRPPTSSGVGGLGAVSLPVAVDIGFDGRGRTEVIADGYQFDLGSWISHLRRAVKVGKELWRAKHGNHGNFRDEVASASVVFDFRTAQKIVADLCREMGQRIALDQGSADAYFAQVVLGKLLGRTAILASAVTGGIGEQIREEGRLTLNYLLTTPTGVVQKARYVFASRNFERLVVPTGARGEISEVLESTKKTEKQDETGRRDRVLQTAEVVMAHDVQTLADIVQVRGWRQSQYIRCPEVAWAIHSAQSGRLGRLEPTDERVKRVAAALAANDTSSVIELNAPPVVVASALWHINTTLRTEIKPYTPPSLSWAFFRPLNEEQDTRFWQVLWGIIGAARAEFEKLLKQRSRNDVVSRLATALNRFEPDADCPSHRAPDITVIIGARRFEESRKETLNPQARTFMVADLLAELGRPGRLHGPFDQRHFPLVGRTRIILLPTDEVLERDGGVATDRLTPREAKVLRALATFQWGFTQQTASLVLVEFGEYRGIETRSDVLDPLVAKGVLRTGQGRYHVPAFVAAALEKEEPARVRAQRYYRAGCALAPYAAGATFPALALDTAFSPEHIHEAERHLALAARYARLAGDERLFQKSRQAFQHLSRFTEVPGWGLVDGLLKAGNLSRDAYEAATELLEWEQTSGTTHPSHLLLAGRAAAQWTKQATEGSTNLELRRRLRREADGYFRQALERCRAFPSEEPFNRLQALTTYAIYLAEHEPQRTETVRELSSEALGLLDRGADPRGVWGQWFELVADQEADHRDATALYRMGFKNVPEWAQLWVKGLGSAALAGLREQMEMIRTTIPEERAVDLISKCRGAYQRQRESSARHVEARWEEGLRAFGDFWPATRVRMPRRN